MPHKLTRPFIALCILYLLVPQRAEAVFAQVFGKASASKTNTSADRYAINLSGAAGLAFMLIPQLRIEGRYTVLRNYKNAIDFGSAQASNYVQQTSIYSVSLDLDILGEKYAVQPFIMLGLGYLVSYEKAETELEGVIETSRKGFAANGGAGLRIRLAKSLALELEAFAYATDPDKPNPLIDFWGNVGVRIFL